MNILEEKNNPLFHRKELIIQIEATTIPSKIEVAKQIAEKTKSFEENIIIEKIDSNFGSQIFKVTALVYDNVESKDKYTIITVKARKKILEDKKKAEEEKKKLEESEKQAEEAKPEEEPTESVNDEAAKPESEPTSEVTEEKAIPDKEPTTESKQGVKEE